MSYTVIKLSNLVPLFWKYWDHLLSRYYIKFYSPVLFFLLYNNWIFMFGGNISVIFNMILKLKLLKLKLQSSSLRVTTSKLHFMFGLKHLKKNRMYRFFTKFCVSWPSFYGGMFFQHSSVIQCIYTSHITYKIKHSKQKTDKNI